MRLLITSILWLACSTTYGQQASDIYLFDLSEGENGLKIANQRNVTHHPGYDNQPHFHPSKSLLFYSSFNDEGRSDIKVYDLNDEKTGDLTTTSEREYSPTVTPDGEFVSCIIQRDDGAQDLGKYPIHGGTATVLINDLIVGYHAWISEDRLLLFVLGQPMTLRLYDLKEKKNKTIAENIGRSLHKIPGQNAMSFIHKVSDDSWIIKRFDNKSEKVTEITTTLDGQEHLTWTPDGRILMSDGKRIMIFDLSEKDATWQPIEMGDAKEKLFGITRLAVSADGKHLAVVADEP